MKFNPGDKVIRKRECLDAGKIWKFDKPLTVKEYLEDENLLRLEEVPYDTVKWIAGFFDLYVPKKKLKVSDILN